MSIWTPFRMRLLPEEQRAEVMKVQIAEEEATKRKTIEAREKTKQERIGNDSYHIVRGLMVAVCAILVIATAIVINDAVGSWQDVRTKEINKEITLKSPPAPPALSAQPMPAFNITVTPATAASAAKP